MSNLTDAIEEWKKDESRPNASATKPVLQYRPENCSSTLSELSEKMMRPLLFRIYTKEEAEAFALDFKYFLLYNRDEYEAHRAAINEAVYKLSKLPFYSEHLQKLMKFK